MALQEETISQADYDIYLKDFFENFATRPEDHDTKYYMKNSKNFFERNGRFKVDWASWIIDREHDFIWTYVKNPGPDGLGKPYLYAYYYKGRWQLVEVYKTGEGDHLNDPKISAIMYSVWLIPKLIIHTDVSSVPKFINEIKKQECYEREISMNKQRRHEGKRISYIKPFVEFQEIIFSA